MLLLITLFCLTTCSFYVSLTLQNLEASSDELLNERQLRVEGMTGDNAAPDISHSVCGEVKSCISIHVFGWKRIQTVQTLLNTLETSNYTGYEDPLPLVIHVDGPKRSDDWKTTNTIRQFMKDFQWTHGPKVLDIKDTNQGLKRSWLTAWPNPKPDDVMVFFEDDMLPSRMYFQWLLKVLTEYKLLSGKLRDPSLLGISLSPMRMDEITYPFRSWRSSEKISLEFPVFLHAVPSSWGAVYFGKPWRDFLNFVDIRSSAPFYEVDESALNLTGYGWHTQRGDPNLWLPSSRSNNWVHSWKRYMVDFAYGRGAYMLYPNLVNSSGLATSTFMEGEHVPTGAYKNGANPRYAPLVEGKDVSLMKPLPSYDTLPLVDMHGESISRRDLSRRGDEFVRRIFNLKSHYSDLAKYWTRPCLLDTATDPGSKSNVKTDRRRLHSPEGCRHLVVAPQMGFSNQLIAVLHSAIWAHLLGRTLVLPHIIWPRASYNDGNTESWVPFHEVFDPVGVLEHLPGLDFVYANVPLMVGWRPERLVLIEPQPSFDKLHDTYLQGIGWTALPSVDLVPHHSSLSTSDKVYQSLGSCDDDVLLLDGLFKNPQRMEVNWKERRKIWQTLFRPNPLVNHMIQIAQQAVLGSESSRQSSANSSAYGCLHIRVGDFSAVCSAKPDSAPWLAAYYKQGRKCNVSLDDALQRANSLGMQTFVVLSDDATMSAQVSAALSKFKVLTDVDFQSLVKHALPRIRPDPSKRLIEVVAALTAQHICAQADRLVLNDFSTFSRSISSHRENNNGIEYW
jgi:hypothetical protein